MDLKQCLFDGGEIDLMEASINDGLRIGEAKLTTRIWDPKNWSVNDEWELKMALQYGSKLNG